MEYSEIVLMAFILLVVFCSAQIPKLLMLLGLKHNDSKLEGVRTVVSASAPVVQTPRKNVVAPKAKKTSAPVKKAVPAKKSATKKKTTKK